MATQTKTKPPEPTPPAEPIAPPEPTQAELIAQRADLVARSIAADIAPASARDQAQMARVRARGSDPEQAAVESRLAELLSVAADEHDKRQFVEAQARGRTKGKIPVHVRAGGAPIGADVPHAIRRGSFVAYHTTPDVPDMLAIVVRLHPEADDNKRYLADVFTIPVVEGSSAATVTNVTYGLGQGQFSELSTDEDDIGRGPEGNVIFRPWQHE